MTRLRTALPQAVVASLVLHALLLAILGPRLGTSAPARPPPVTVLAMRLEPAPERAVVKPAAPPAVLKDTLDPPQAKPLEDPITSRERRRIADKDQPARTPKPKPDAPPPRPEAPKPRPEAPKPLARTEPLGRGLDLRVPRTPQAERLNPDQLRETLGRLSEELLYPADALRRGLEGEVVILVELGEDGRILGASVASGSGHQALDDAAVRAVKRLGSLGPASAHKSILLPVRFRII
jgi:protein TonB